VNKVVVVVVVSKTLEASANLVTDAMLVDDKSFEDVKGWLHAHKEKLVPVHDHDLKSRLKDELRTLEPVRCRGG